MRRMEFELQFVKGTTVLVGGGDGALATDEVADSCEDGVLCGWNDNTPPITKNPHELVSTEGSTDRRAPIER